MPSKIPDSLKNLISDCTAQFPTDRPTFSDICTRLDYVLVDCLIDDPVGRELWKKRFLDKELKTDVKWNEFWDIFSEYLPSKAQNIKNALNMRSLLCAENIDNNIVTLRQFGRLLNWFPLDFNAPEDHTIVDKISKLLENEWFHSFISLAEANKRLSDKSNGTFLIRFSDSTPGGYALGIAKDSKPEHHKILPTPDKKLQFHSMIFDSLEDLVAGKSHGRSKIDFGLKSSCARPTTLSGGYVPDDQEVHTDEIIP